MHETEPLWKVCGKLMTSRHGEKESFSDFSSLPFMLVSWPLVVVVADDWERCAATGGITSIFIYFFIFMLNKYLTPSIYYIAKSIIHFSLQHDFLIYQKVWDFRDFDSFNTQPHEIRLSHCIFFIRLTTDNDDDVEDSVLVSISHQPDDWWTDEPEQPSSQPKASCWFGWDMCWTLNTEYVLLCKRSHENHSHENVVKSLSINGTENKEIKKEIFCSCTRFHE